MISGSYSHSPNSGLERGSPSIEDFYRDDELKYHGKKNRGVMTLDFTAKTEKASDDACTPSVFKFPTGCSGDACEYQATWIRNTATEIEVEVRHKVGEGMWTAIGFTENNFMVNGERCVFVGGI